MRTLAVFLLCLLPTICHAQITMQSLEKVTVYRGIEKQRVLKDLLIVPAGTKLVGESAAVIPVESAASQVTVRASDVTRNNLTAELVDETTNAETGIILRQYIVVATGKVWLDVTAIDFEKKIFDQQSFVVDLGGEPDRPDEPDKPDVPTPGPDKPVPEDRFDNIGQKVASAAKGLTLRKEVAAVYRTHADELVGSANATDVSHRMIAERANVLGSQGANWAPVLRAIMADFNPRVADMQRADVVDYWRAVANGLDPQGAM